MAATNEQVQTYVNERFRVRAEQFRAIYLAAKDDKAVMDDVYANVNDGGSTFSDTRTDGPPHLITRTDVLAYNTFLERFIAFIEGTLTDLNKNEAAGQWPVMQDACVRPVQL
jgi:predicted TPR repeat methyltransferase